MDGTHPKSYCPIRERSHLMMGSLIGNSVSWLLLLMFCFMVLPSAAGNDLPVFFRRSIARGKNKAPSRDEASLSSNSTRPHGNPLQLSPIIRTSSESVELPVPAGSAEARSKSDLRRFPLPSTTAAAGESPVMDFTFDLGASATFIDLPTALQLAGWKSPEVLLVQQKVLAATARQQLAAAQALPNLNMGTNFDSHSGALQRSSGSILQVQRSALYVGAGGNAVGAGTVNLPGLQYNLNVGETYFAYLVSRQLTERSNAAARVTSNNTLLQVAQSYCQLVQAQGTRAIAMVVRDDAAEIARITAAFAKAGEGRPADAERAATELGRREADIYAAEAAIIEASSNLCQILNLESSVRLQSSENWIVPRPVVPDPIPLPELIAIALYQRPEIAERRAEVHAAMLELDNAKLLLFSPQFIAGFSDGAFGGGGDVNTTATGSPRFGDIGNRTDTDIVLYWSIRNLGLANRALIKVATARMAATDWERTKRLNEIRAEVADAYARTQATAAQLDIRQRAVSSSDQGFREDLQRAKAGEGRPIEVLDSLRLLSRAQQDYLETIASYNLAHYALYVAIGQPPADLLIHSAPPTVDETLPPQPAERR